MRCRVLTAASVCVAGACIASVVLAAAPDIGSVPAAMRTFAPSTTATLGESLPANFALGGVTAPPSGQAATASFPISLAPDNGGVRVDLSSGRNWQTFGSLFSSSSALSSGYLSGASSYAGATFALGDDVNLEFGHANLALGAFGAGQPGTFSSDLAQRLRPGANIVGTTSANLNWNFSDWGGLAIMASRSNGNGSLLGTVNTGIGSAGLADSSSLGISARVGFGEGWVTTFAYSEGVTQLDLNRDQLITKLDPVHSQAYALGVAKQGLFGADALGIAVSRPLQIYSGDNLGAINSSFASSQARESDLELGYVTSFLDGTLALQANAAYQLNPAGAKGQTAVTGVARAKLNF